MNNLDRIFTKDPVSFAGAYLDYLTSVLKTIDAREIGQFIETLLDARERGATIFLLVTVAVQQLPAILQTILR